MSEIDINEIFENAMKDPELFSRLDIEKLLENIENEKNNYLDGKTMKSINDEIYEKISQFKSCDHQEICNKLIGYRYVDELHELHKGKHVRWIRLYKDTTKMDDIKLTNGGIVTDIKFMNNGTHVLCMNSMRRFIQYKFDECLTFQKLSMEEQLILMAYEHIEKDS
jgi:YesN/AraC family two-component response regulator